MGLFIKIEQKATVSATGRFLLKFFSLLVVATCCLLYANLSYSQIPQSEREALIALYYASNGDNWTNKTGWNGAVGTECDWYGVTCSGSDLTELILSSNNLVGTIPSGLGNLATLTTLQLGSNSLSGSIPTELGNLTSVAYLTF